MRCLQLKKKNENNNWQFTDTSNSDNTFGNVHGIEDSKSATHQHAPHIKNYLLKEL